MSDTNSVHERLEMRRSRVRVWVTYAAAAYIFVGSAILIAWFALAPSDSSGVAHAKEVFTMVLPIATGVVTYWFAARRPASTEKQVQ